MLKSDIPISKLLDGTESKVFLLDAQKAFNTWKEETKQRDKNWRYLLKSWVSPNSTPYDLIDIDSIDSSNGWFNEIIKQCDKAPSNFSLNLLDFLNFSTQPHRASEHLVEGEKFTKQIFAKEKFNFPSFNKNWNPNGNLTEEEFSKVQETFSILGENEEIRNFILSEFVNQTRDIFLVDFLCSLAGKEILNTQWTLADENRAPKDCTPLEISSFLQAKVLNPQKKLIRLPFNGSNPLCNQGPSTASAKVNNNSPSNTSIPNSSISSNSLNPSNSIPDKRKDNAKAWKDKNQKRIASQQKKVDPNPSPQSDKPKCSFCGLTNHVSKDCKKRPGGEWDPKKKENDNKRQKK